MNIDFLIWPHLERMEALINLVKEFDVTLDEFPLISKWIQLITAVPAVKDTITPIDDHLKLWEGMKAGTFNYDYGLEE